MHLTKFRALLIVCNVCLTLDNAYSFNDRNNFNCILFMLK